MGLVTWIGLVIAIVAGATAYQLGRRAASGGQTDGGNLHVLSYFCWTLAVTIGLAAALLHSGKLYQLIGGVGFLSGNDGKGVFDAGSYVGLLAVLLGIPLAVSGSFYAIYLAQASLAISRNQLALSKRQMFLEHPFFQPFSKLAVVRKRIQVSIALFESVRRPGASDAGGLLATAASRTKDLVESLQDAELREALILAKGETGATAEISDYESRILDLERILGTEHTAEERRKCIGEILGHLRALESLVPAGAELMATLEKGVANAR